MEQLRVVLVLALAAAAAAQYVSPYAQGWHRFPGVLPQYLSGSGSGSGLDNRQGEVTSQFDLETRVSQLPADRQPYWFINKEALQAIKQQHVPA